jgi:hypothetical protein
LKFGGNAKKLFRFIRVRDISYEETRDCGDDLGIVRHIPDLRYDIPVIIKKV